MKNTEAAFAMEGSEFFKRIANENFKKWNEVLVTKDPKKVASLYADDVSFLPTLSEKFINDLQGTEGYFEHFLSKDPYGKIIGETVQPLSDTSYCHSGLYNFEVGPKHDRAIVEARFTYIWKQEEPGAWKIIHHHSSLKPKK